MQGTPKVGSVHHGPVDRMELGFILAISWFCSASHCLLPQFPCGTSEGALFCQYQTSPSFVEKADYFGNGFIFLNAMSYVFYLEEQLLRHLPLSLVKMKEFKVIVRFIPCAS